MLIRKCYVCLFYDSCPFMLVFLFMYFFFFFFFWGGGGDVNG